MASYMTKPSAAEIRHFLQRVRDLDRSLAMQHYIRTGEPPTGSPDEIVMKVLDWLNEVQQTADQ